MYGWMGVLWRSVLNQVCIVLLLILYPIMIVLYRALVICDCGVSYSTVGQFCVWFGNALGDSFSAGHGLAMFNRSDAVGVYCLLNYFHDYAHFTYGFYMSGSRYYCDYHRCNRENDNSLCCFGGCIFWNSAASQWDGLVLVASPGHIGMFQIDILRRYDDKPPPKGHQGSRYL